MVSAAVSQLLCAGIRAGASDWHLDEGKRPAWRVEGRLTILPDQPPLTRDDLQAIVADTAGAAASEGDGTLRHKDELFRVSFGPTREGRSVVMRHVPATYPTLAELGVPPSFVRLLDARAGLLLISGPTGCGKSTTLNSAISHLNAQSEGGTITILGDPIEYYHAENRCRIRHREFGRDFSSWPEMLARTLRQDPDVICVSELRDPATMGMALAAAETGHLVLGTLHNASAKDSVSRIIETCPESDREQQRALLAKALRGVLAQLLVPSPGGRRIAAFELLVNTEGVANLIRERRFRQIDDEILRGRQHGMQAMDESLAQLAASGRITRATALRYARHQPLLENLLKSS